MCGWIRLVRPFCVFLAQTHVSPTTRKSYKYIGCINIFVCESKLNCFVITANCFIDTWSIFDMIVNQISWLHNNNFSPKMAKNV